MTMHINSRTFGDGLGPKLLAVAQAWRRALAQMLVDQGLSDATGLPLLHLYKHGDNLRQGDLAEMLGLETTSVVRILDHLEKDELVRRESDPDDRRVKRILLTPMGADVARQAQALADDLRSHVLGNISEDDLETVTRALDSISNELANRKQKPRKT